MSLTQELATPQVYARPPAFCARGDILGFGLKCRTQLKRIRVKLGSESESQFIAFARR